MAINNPFPDWVTPGWVLGIFLLIFILALVTSHELTREQIALQEKVRLAKTLKQLLPSTGYNNQPENDIYLDQQTNRTVYRARQDNQPVAALITAQAPDGYNGFIQLLVSIKTNGELIGVRVLKHQETPGLGDGIEQRKSNWILSFNGQSLNHLTKDQWAVKPDGGQFDALTGATITSRAIVKATYRTLVYFQENDHRLFQ